jgi:glycosyltransferase involved in cell wall biosynthesis
LVSVIVPLYNHAAYVRQCLDSIAAEGYPELEVVVLDDGSKDDSYAVAAAWFAEHGAQFRSWQLLRQENKGICTALNRLILASAGTYVLPIASDDRLLPGGIAPRVEMLEKHPRSLAVMTNVRIIDDANNVLTDEGLFHYFRMSKPHLLDARSRPAEILLNTMGGPLLMVRRSAYVGPDGIGLYDEAMSFEDRDFFLRILARPEGLLYLDKVVAEYRIHADNHVGDHVVDKTRHARIAPDYVAMGYRHADLYHGSLRRAILLDAWEAKAYWNKGFRGPLQRRVTQLVRRYKMRVLADHRRKARSPRP